MSLPHFRDSQFLADAVRRYKQYLLLKQRHPDNFLVPCYDMDVVWHTHQLQPAAYAEDTSAILGQVLDHDDSVNDRAAGSKLCNSQQVTEKLWKGNPCYKKRSKSVNHVQIRHSSRVCWTVKAQ